MKLLKKLSFLRFLLVEFTCHDGCSGVFVTVTNKRNYTITIHGFRLCAWSAPVSLRIYHSDCERCNMTDGYVNKRHESAFEKDGWADRSNYNLSWEGTLKGKSNKGLEGTDANFAHNNRICIPPFKVETLF